MNIIPAWIQYIPKSYRIQLLAIPTAVYVQRDQDWPRKAATDKTYHTEHFKIAKKEEAVK
jgi:hypothetical protein